VVDILATVERVGLCEGTPQYGIIEQQLRRTADLRDREGTGGLDVDCNAASVGARLTGFPTRIGGVVPSPPAPDACAAGTGGS
jgi:hypothetical protein